MEILNLTVDDFDRETVHAIVPVLVDFWAPWCGPCKMAAPIVEELAEELGAQARICKVNVDEQPQIAQALRISSIPTFMVFQNGSVVNMAVGVKSKEELKKLLGVL